MNDRREYVPPLKRSQEGLRDEDNKPWWQTAGVETFRAKVKDLTLQECELLAAEIDGARQVIQAQLDTRGRADHHWWHGARMALGYITEKRILLSTELHLRNKKAGEAKQAKKDQRFSERVAELRRVRALIAEGSLEKAMLLYVDNEIAYFTNTNKE